SVCRRQYCSRVARWLSGPHVKVSVVKMNIDTDTQFAFSEAVGKFVEKNAKAFKYQIDPEDGTPYKKLYDPRKWLRIGEEGIVARLNEAYIDLKSAGKSLAECDSTKAKCA
ncbi:MAG: class II fructose-bisphosphate aldolase, partial [Micavibrio sp.]